MVISAGDLKYVVAFKSPTTTIGNEGEKNKVFETAFTARAKVERTNQQRAMEAGAPALLNTDVVIIRAVEDREAIRMDWLLNYSGSDHVIQSIEYVGRWIKLIVKADDKGAKTEAG